MRKTILTLTALLLNLLNAGAQQTDAFPYPSVPDTSARRRHVPCT